MNPAAGAAWRETWGETCQLPLESSAIQKQGRLRWEPVN